MILGRSSSASRAPEARSACSSAGEPLLDLLEELDRVLEVADVAPVDLLWVDAILMLLEGEADRLEVRGGLGLAGGVGVGLVLGLDRCAALCRAHGCLLGFVVDIASPFTLCGRVKSSRDPASTHS